MKYYCPDDCAFAGGYWEYGELFFNCGASNLPENAELVKDKGKPRCPVYKKGAVGPEAGGSCVGALV